MNKKFLIAVTVTQLISTMGFEEPLPQCSGQDVVFTVSPRDVIIPCGREMTAQFPCQYTYKGSEGTEHPWWTIGSIPYGRSLPPNHDYDSGRNILIVSNITITQSNTSYICEFHTRENNSLCAYQSEPGIMVIICEVTQFQPYYQYNTSTTQAETLTGIVTIIHENKLKYFTAGIFYYTIYSYLPTGEVCDVLSFPSNSTNCYSEVCKYDFNIAASECYNQHESITVFVWITNYGSDFPLSNPTTINYFNKFARISFQISDEAAIMIARCKFMESPVESVKTCSILVGPNCSNMHYETESIIAQTNLVAFSIDLSFLEHSTSTEFCFVATASTKSKTVIIEGVHHIASTLSVHRSKLTKIVILALIVGLLLNLILLKE